MLMNMQDEKRQVQGNARERPASSAPAPPPKVAGPAVLCRTAKNGKTNDLCHVQDEKQQKAQQREAEASSSAASDPLLATKTAFDSKERKRALQKES